MKSFFTGATKMVATRRSKAATAAPPVEEDDVSTSSSEHVANDNDDDSSSGSDDDSEASGGSAQDMSEEDDDASSSDEEMDDKNNTNQQHSATTDDDINDDTANTEQCTFDLHNLLAFNTHQINAAELYQQSTKSKKKSLNKEWYTNTPTIDSSTTKTALLLPTVNENLLLSKAAEGTTQLLCELWKLPSEKTDVGLVSKLPSAEVKLPRALPPPPPKQMTKWEQFAKERGIAPKSKTSRKVYDESTGEWKHLTGSLQNKANAGPESWPIIEVKKNDDPMANPWEKLRDEKKSRISKNVEARMRNAERSGVLDRGSANKLVKNNKRLEKQRDIAREKDKKRGLDAPVGVPTDLKSRDAKRGKPSTALALKATQVSTASLGKFDKQREGEPEKQLHKSIHGNTNKKRKSQDGSSSSGGGTNKKFLASEAQKSTDILSRVMNGTSSKQREREIKKGKYARGETAYDYEYDDGVGDGKFKKKKGRAGMGKMKKVTKKRIK